MRFLLETARKSGTRTMAKKLNSASCTQTTRAWGQQCSPDCGCVVRFEANIGEDNEIQSAKYHAKTVLTTYVNGQLEPQMTLNQLNPKPIMKECNCSTLHSIASEVTSFLKDKNILSTVRNQMEFTGPRSSVAFQHAVLANLDLPRTDTHCFDLVEEALAAMVKGYIPGQRTKKTSFQQHLANHYQPKITEDDELDEEFVVRYGRALRRIRKTRFGSDGPMNISSTRNISALRMFDLNLDEEEHEHNMQKSTEPPQTRTMDWEAYVDEMDRERQQESA